MKLKRKLKLKKRPSRFAVKTIEKRSKKILAFDIATTTGFCYGLNHHGFFNNKPNKDESNGFRLIRFEDMVIDIINISKPDVLYFERVSGHHVQAVKVQSQFQGILERLCLKRDIPYSSKSATEIKKFITGKGNSGKAKVVECINNKLESLGMSPVKDDNECDAIALWLMANKELNE